MAIAPITPVLQEIMGYNPNFTTKNRQFIPNSATKISENNPNFTTERQLRTAYEIDNQAVMKFYQKSKKCGKHELP